MSMQAARLLAHPVLDKSSGPHAWGLPINLSSIGSYLVRLCWWFALTGLLLGVVAGQPVAAQESNPICADESGTLPRMIEVGVQLMVGLGLMGVVVVVMANQLADMFSLDAERKQVHKARTQKALRSITVIILIGPVFTLFGKMAGLPVAQCVDLIPF